jgi:hypothetical protein
MTPARPFLTPRIDCITVSMELRDHRRIEIRKREEDPCATFA